MREELGKLFRGKLIFCLVLLSVAVNACLLFMQRDKIDALRLLDQFNRENGSAVSDAKMAMLAERWNENDVNGISWKEFEKDIERAAGYYRSVQSNDMADACCSSMRLEGKAAEYVRTEFHKLDSLFAEAARQELTFFLPYRMRIFDFIAIYLLFALNLEGITAAVIVTLYSVDLERSSRTAATVYSTWRGQRILRGKLIASVVGSLICFLAVVMITLLLAGCVFPVDTVRKTLLSNPMVNLTGSPCIAREVMTIGKYLLTSLGVSCILVVIYSLGSFAVGIRVKNGYYALGLLVVLLGIMKVFSAAAPTSTCMFFWLQYNPLDMAMKAGTWFLYSSDHFSPSGYEACTAVLWIAVCTVGCICGLRSMERRREKV